MKTVLKLTRIALFDLTVQRGPIFSAFARGSILSGAQKFAVGCFAALSGCLAYCFTTSGRRGGRLGTIFGLRSAVTLPENRPSLGKGLQMQHVVQNHRLEACAN